jgi:hypothetical protein
VSSDASAFNYPRQCPNPVVPEEQPATREEDETVTMSIWPPGSDVAAEVLPRRAARRGSEPQATA